MPTKEVQAVIDAALPIATKYAMLKRISITSPTIAQVEPDGWVSYSKEDLAVDLKHELDNLVIACADLVDGKELPTIV